MEMTGLLKPKSLGCALVSDRRTRLMSTAVLRRPRKIAESSLSLVELPFSVKAPSETLAALNASMRAVNAPNAAHWIWSPNPAMGELKMKSTGPPFAV